MQEMSGLLLIIGNKNYSSWSLRPWVFMQHNAIPFEESRVPLFTETTRNSLTSYNSDYKVPVLKDKHLEIWDSLSILEYLAEKYPAAQGWPEDAGTRAVARSISAEMHSSFSHVRNEMPMNCRKKFDSYILSDDAMREVDRIQTLWTQCRTQYGSSGGEWLFGEYSIADAMFAPIALRFNGYGIKLNKIGCAYVQSVLAQPCIIQWLEAASAESEVIETGEV